MKVIYMAHPLSGDVEVNIAKAKRWLRWMYKTHPEHAVIANWILDAEILDDDDPEDRAQGLARDMALVRRCDEVYLVGGRISEGMRLECEAAKAAGIPIVDLTPMGEEPPF